ncbi:MAG: hypothetical protein CMM87_01355 [Rickettsiales bacterium]|nr:hypothetical protein [Rickettsiales bacterium]|tara:strand:+ start:53923 stop:55194 length:1272 start_codon:yes stop_codon:yes gene_type:complete
MKSLIKLTTLSLLIAISANAESNTKVANSVDQKKGNQINTDWFKKPQARVKGKLMFIAGANSAKKRDSRIDQASFSTKGDFGLSIFADGLNNDSYGADIVFDLRREKRSSPDFIRAAYAYYNTEDYGTIKVGEMEGALEQTILDGRDIMGATGGFGGELFTFATPSTGTLSYYQHAGYDKYATKLLYQTPTINGFQFVASFTPHSQLLGSRSRGANEDNNTGFAGGVNSKNVMVRRVIEGVASYGFNTNGTDVNLYLGGSVADSSTRNVAGASAENVRSAKSFLAGLLVDFGDIQFGAGYMNNGKSLVRKDLSETYGDAVNAAVSYALGRHYVAAGHMASWRKVEGGKAKANISSVTYEYKAAPGLTLFSEVNYFNTRNTSQYYNAAGNATQTTRGNNKRIFPGGIRENNKGAVVLFGTAIRY